MTYRVASKTRQLLEARARSLRAEPTHSEARLWRELRACRVGVRFRRQVPIGRFIVDFLAPSHRLVVEVDGGYHAQRRRADARRDEQLLRMGYRVLRLEAELVERDVAAAVQLVRSHLDG